MWKYINLYWNVRLFLLFHYRFLDVSRLEFLKRLTVSLWNDLRLNKRETWRYDLTTVWDYAFYSIPFKKTAGVNVAQKYWWKVVFFWPSSISFFLFRTWTSQFVSVYCHVEQHIEKYWTRKKYVWDLYRIQTILHICSLLPFVDFKTKSLYRGTSLVLSYKYVSIYAYWCVVLLIR